MSAFQNRVWRMIGEQGGKIIDNRLSRVMLTVFPLLVWISASAPFIFSTCPSIQANAGSSAQTCEPTIMFTGVPCSN